MIFFTINPIHKTKSGCGDLITGQKVAVRTGTLEGVTHVRFGSEADMCDAKAYVRSGPIADIREVQH